MVAGAPGEHGRREVGGLAALKLLVFE